LDAAAFARAGATDLDWPSEDQPPATAKTIPKVEQAANRRRTPCNQPAAADTHDKHAKVEGTITASPLVKRRPCLRSHGRGHRFETSSHDDGAREQQSRSNDNPNEADP
jgi:hypothetical protein